MELMRLGSHEGSLLRRILMFAMTVLVAAFLVATIVTASANAQTPGADWKGDSILYDGKQYFVAADATAGQSHGLPVGTKYYVASDEATGSGTSASRKAYIIYFSPGVDPPTATTAKYATYDLSSTDIYSNRQDGADITIKPQGTSDSYSSCSVDGVGWIICPVSIFLAEGMDTLFKLLSTFVAVQPLTVNDTNSPLHVAWNVMRNIANIAFIILFLIIIFSQLTSWGISSYGLKRLLPRLVVAAILVNVSFYVSAIAVDLSNILGYGLQEILISIRQNTFAVTDQTWDPEATNWVTITATVLSGGAIGYVGLAGATGGSIGAALYLLVPLLIGLLLTALFVLLILAARQAIIVILVVISPLAFVANLLPNTEKWFEKWRDLFMSMLIFFPAFSLVFGGSQLAGGIIIQNASGPYGFVMMIFGLAVQVAPLVITPLILKLSTGILGRIAQLANDPRKGLLDKTKNWSGNRAEMHRQRSLGNTARPKTRGGRIAKSAWNGLSGRALAQRMDNSNRRIKDLTSDYEKQSENRYMTNKKYAGLYEQQHDTETDRKIIDSTLSRNLNNHTANDPRHFEKAFEASTREKEAEDAKKLLAGSIENARNGVGIAYGPQTQSMSQLMEEAKSQAVNSSAIASRLQAAEATTQQTVAAAFKTIELKSDGSNLAEYTASQALLTFAGGIQGTTGITRAQASATALLTKMEKEVLDNNVGLIRYEASQSGRTAKELSLDLTNLRLSNNASDRARVNDAQLEAALELVADDGQVTQIEAARANEFVDQSIVDRVIARNEGTLKSKGGFHLQAQPKLSLQRYIETFRSGNTEFGTTEAAVRAQFDKDMKIARLESFSNTPADQLGGMKFGAFMDTAGKFEDFRSAMDLDSLPTDSKVYKERVAILNRIHEAVQVALTDDGIYGSITDRLVGARAIDKDLSGFFDTHPIDPRPAELRTQVGQPERTAREAREVPDVDPTAETPADSSDD